MAQQKSLKSFLQGCVMVVGRNSKTETEDVVVLQSLSHV